MDKEYLMLREEILHLSETISNTTNFFYAFIAAYMAAIFAIPEKDTIYILIMYIVILPAYMIVLNKAHAMYKAGAYLFVFHESKGGSAFNWEKMNIRLTKCNMPIKLFSFDWFQSHMRAYHFPFLFSNLVAAILFVAGTCQNYQNIFNFYDGIKILIFLFLFSITSVMIHKERGITTLNYVKKWEELHETSNL